MDSRKFSDWHSRLCSLLGGAILMAAVALPPPARADEIDARIDALLAKMSLADKVGQLNQISGGSADADAAVREKLLSEIRAGRVGSVLGATGAEYTNMLQRVAVEESPHKIPLLIANDVIHGYRTIFPIPLGEAASWNPALIKTCCQVAAREARAGGTHWTFAPMVDVCRDPRWGRIAETAGEDTYLGSVIAAARVRGFQQAADGPHGGVMACAKHFAAYGGAEGGRDYNTVDISRRTLHEIYLPTFHAAVKAGAGSFMTSFNEISGIPATANNYILRDVLRRGWRFNGIVISDYNAIGELIPHGFAADGAAAAEKAIRAGVDIDMCAFLYEKHAAALVESGRLPAALLDEAVRRVLAAKFGLGLFEQPYADAAHESRTLLDRSHRVAALAAAAGSLVLLRNEGGLLPIRSGVERIALIGPLAENRADLLGTWACIGRAEDVVPLSDGLRKALPNAAVKIVRGSEFLKPITGGIDEAVAAAKASQVAILAVGESEDMSGEAHSRAEIDLPAPQLELVKAVHAAGVPTVVVVFTGRPLAIPWLAENIPAILVAWHPGIEGGNAVADTLIGTYNPGGKLPATFPRSVGQIPLYYNHKNSGRPPVAGERYTSKYIDIDWTPQFPFGFGLSYTRFEYSAIELSHQKLKSDGVLEVSVDVRNAGDRRGDEVVQAYFHDCAASVTRPVRQLIAFQRIGLSPGETYTCRFRLSVADMGFYDADMKFVVEPGVMELYVGGSSAGGLKATFEIVE
ncbi:Periplasmic beta-glucosidase precursor [Phycisphaerae bacterium RAS1]|nr:Periplasmic beta-glucosidase precursor [Phycisphaerae bacterium RAS1]